MNLKKEELRKVKIAKHSDGSGGYIINAYFHQFAQYPLFTDNGTFQNTSAIVELEDGTVKSIQPSNVKFVEEF